MPTTSFSDITFTGLTADPRRLLATIVTPNGLKSQPTTSAARYIAGEPRHPTSEVIVQHPSPTALPAPPRAEVMVDLRRDDVVQWRSNARQEPEPNILPSGYRRW